MRQPSPRDPRNGGPADLLWRPVAADNAAMESEPTTADPPKRKRRWFQFSLRTLLLFTLICAVAASWVAHRMDKKRAEREAIAAIRKAGGLVYHDCEEVHKDTSGKMVASGTRGPEWLQKLVGDDFFTDPLLVSFIKVRESTEATMTIVGELDELRWLFLAESNVTDAGLANLMRLRQLTNLNLGGTNITDAGLAHLTKLRKIEYLMLDRTKITDAGLVHLEGIDSLWRLSLTNTNVTDAGLEHLRRLTKLDALWLEGTKVTKAGIESLQESLPNCEIFWPKEEDWNHNGGAN
jgi:hypothetical protein